MTSPQAVPPDDADAPVLQAIDLRKHFPVRGFRSHKVVHAVDDVNLSLYRGKVVALVGESGSGKSTIARLLAQLMPVTGGQLLLHGQDATAKNRRAFGAYVRRVQMIFQDPFGSLNPVHTVRYTLTRSLKIHRGRLRGVELEAALEELLDRVQLRPAAPYIDKFPHELSGGQRQRVGIARALASNPALIVADEPVSALDVSVRAQILKLMFDLQRERKLSYLFITHDLGVVRAMADRVMVMHQGRVVESGDADAVLNTPRDPYTQRLLAATPVPDPSRQLK